MTDSIATSTPKEPTGKHRKLSAKKMKRRKRQKISGTCFVLMPFKEPFDTYYNALIEPAVRAVYLEPLRGDSLFRPSPIMGDVWQMIQDAKVLVAELTEKNANVFYELGLAHAIGKPVILVSETIQDVPFDLQPLRVLLYNKSNPAWGATLKADLISSLEETIEDVARAVPPMFRKIVKSQAPEESPLAVRLFDLERRVASMEPLRQDSIMESPRILNRPVDWERVDEYLERPKEMGLSESSLSPTSRDQALAWAITQLRRVPPPIVRRRIREALGPAEGEWVFNLAMHRGRRPAQRSIAFASRRRARER